MKLYDITRTLTPRTAVFPGDTPVAITPTMQMRNGDSANVTSLAMSAHAGTHVDAPRHYADDGEGIDGVSLDILIGPARVVTLDVREVITVHDLETIRQPTPDSLPPIRLLIHTRASDAPDDVWSADFVYFTSEAAEWLGANGVQLIGTDAPSVDPATSKDLPAHRAFLKHDVIILENLCLRGVPDGDYELIALPLKIKDNDAAPARVILRN
jgi:arylformamidase